MIELFLFDFLNFLYLIFYREEDLILNVKYRGFGVYENSFVDKRNFIIFWEGYENILVRIMLFEGS